MISAGSVVETTGAGDVFNAGFAVGLAEGRNVIDAERFGCATTGTSVTRPGYARPRRDRGAAGAVVATLRRRKKSNLTDDVVLIAGTNLVA